MNHFLRSLLAAAVACAAQAADQPNILFISVDDLRTELPCYGVGYIHTPNIDKLAAQGRVFKEHYVQAPTCGASRFSLLIGRYPKNGYNANNAITKHTQTKTGERSLPETFRANGYTTLAIGKISHNPGGQNNYDSTGGKNLELPASAWDYLPRPEGLWKSPKGIMHGLANGLIRIPGKTPATEAVENGRYPDDLLVEQFNEYFPKLTADKDKAWFCAVGFIRPHLPFGCPKKFHDIYADTGLPAIPSPQKPEKTALYHPSAELMNGYAGIDPRKDPARAIEVRKHYAACVSYADHNVGLVLDALEKSGQADHTIVVLWGDHGWLLGDHNIWGKHTLYREALAAPLIIRTPGMSKPGIATDSIAETTDIYPTLCALAGIPAPKHLVGASLIPQLQDPSAASDGKAYAYWTGMGESLITPNEHIITGKFKFDRLKDPHEETFIPLK